MKRLSLAQARERHVINATHEKLLKRDGITQVEEPNQKDFTSISYQLTLEKFEKVMDKVCKDMLNADYVLIRGKKGIIIITAHFFIRENSQKLIEDLTREFAKKQISVFCRSYEDSENFTTFREWQMYSVSA